MQGRALTEERKRAVAERILAAWMRVPELRLGQFISNARAWNGSFPSGGLFYTEDEELAILCEAFAADVTRGRAPGPAAAGGA
jgi:hypothetical protein